MAARRDEMTASIMNVRFMAPSLGLPPPVLARAPIGFLRLPRQKRKILSGARSFQGAAVNLHSCPCRKSNPNMLMV
jgi:hypothetical protein